MHLSLLAAGAGAVQPRTASYAQRPPRAAAVVLRPPGASSQSTGRGGGGGASPPPACITFLRERRPAVAAQAVEHRRRVLDVGSPANTRGRRVRPRIDGSGRQQRVKAGNGVGFSRECQDRAGARSTAASKAELAWWRLLGCVERRPEAMAGRELARPRSCKGAWGRRRPRTRTCAATSASCGEDEAQHDVGRHRSFSGSSCPKPACT